MYKLWHGVLNVIYSKNITNQERTFVCPYLGQMLVYEYKIKANSTKLAAIDGAIRTGQYIRNKCLRYWMDAAPEQKINRFALNRYSTIVANDPEMPFAKLIHSNARQSSAERAWAAISRFYNAARKKGVPGKKGYPRYKKNSRSIEYKVGGWKLSSCRKYITFTDKTGIGCLKLVGSRDIQFADLKDIKRIRLIKRADGYYCQFCIKNERLEDCTLTGNSIGIDVGLESFYTDSNGEGVANPRYLRKAEKRLKRLQKQVSRQKKGSSNRRKAINKLGRQHLTISRRRKDFVVKTARALCTSNDVIVLENLNVRNLVKNHNLAKSISDASWRLFRQWLEYFGSIFDREIIAVNPAYTSQDCSNCGKRVKKSLSTRTHQCSCGAKLCRDENAAINILNKGTVGHTATTPVYGVNASGQMTLWLDLETS